MRGPNARPPPDRSRRVKRTTRIRAGVQTWVKIIAEPPPFPARPQPLARGLPVVAGHGLCDRAPTYELGVRAARTDLHF